MWVGAFRCSFPYFLTFLFCQFALLHDVAMLKVKVRASEGWSQNANDPQPTTTDAFFSFLLHTGIDEQQFRVNKALLFGENYPNG